MCIDSQPLTIAQVIGMADEHLRRCNSMEILKTMASSSGHGLYAGGRYQIKRELGRGGFGIVFLAHDPQLRRDVAIKRIIQKHGLPLIDDVISRFKHEAQAVAGLNHPNIVQIYDYAEDQDGYFIVMEYVDGGSLKDFLTKQGGQLPQDQAIELMVQICAGLELAHSRGMVHRDIKPGNILLRYQPHNIPKVADFGLALGFSPSSVGQQTHGCGTPVYMAPEQRSPGTLTPAADVYALGKTLHEMLTGIIGYDIDLDDSPAPEKAKIIIRRCLAQKPAERYQNAGELGNELKHIYAYSKGMG